jgi:hypothetical protein
MSPSSDLIEHLGGRPGPDEGLWIGNVMLEVVLDGGFEFGNAFEDAAADAVSGDEAEEALLIGRMLSFMGITCDAAYYRQQAETIASWRKTTPTLARGRSREG